jgi:hypothetical protein
MSGIMLILRSQCSAFVSYSTKSEQDSSTGLDYRNPRHPLSLSVRKQNGQALSFVTLVQFQTRAED